MALPVALLWAATALSALGTGAQIYSAKKAADAQDDAQKLEQAMAEQTRVRNLRQAINQARVQRAQAIVSGQAQTGSFASSGLQGGLASQGSQLASNIGFSQTQLAANRGINEATRRANRYTTQGSIAQAIGGIPQQFGLNPYEQLGKYYGF